MNVFLEGLEILQQKTKEERQSDLHELVIMHEILLALEDSVKAATLYRDDDLPACPKCKVVKTPTDSKGFANNYCNTCGKKLHWRKRR